MINNREEKYRLLESVDDPRKVAITKASASVRKGFREDESRLLSEEVLREFLRVRVDGKVFDTEKVLADIEQQGMFLIEEKRMLRRAP